ncbi:major facilitator superfamily domain-containing protein [Dendryphion nanum]|uniref:Major facilitator superfamily domain-containing protein n=1 Tax=Dendryphion nanum TaxID=256645 RepID=A0A9P9D9L4_9PLEO|nr:major facilitator superfamily domain-containing protein [Dendryphion nanum]
MFRSKQSSSSPHVKELEPQYLTGFPLAVLFVLICISAIQNTLEMTILATAIPSITTYFGTVQDVDWYGNAYLFTICVLQPLTGHIYRLFEIKRTLLVFLFLFALGTFVSAIGKSSTVFIIGRAIAGIGCAGLFTGNMVIITAAAAPAIRPQLLSVSVAMVGIGGVVGPVLGGVITERLGWRWCLWIFLPSSGLLAISFMLMHIPDAVQKGPARQTFLRLHHEIDLVGFSLFAPACVMFLLAISWGGSKFPWGSAVIIALLVAAFVSTLLSISWICYRKERALLPPHIMMKPVVLYGSIATLLQGGVFLMMQFYLPLWFQSVKEASPEQGGIMMLPTCIAQIVASICCAILLKPVPYAPVWGVFGNLCAAVGAGLMTTFQPTTSAGKWIGYQIIVGIGRGFSMQIPLVAAQSTLLPSESSIAIAMLLFSQFFGGSIVNCIAKTIFINDLRPALHQYVPSVDPQKVIDAGATEIIKLVEPKDVQGIIVAYNRALTVTFWLPTAAACLALLFTFGLGWHKVSVAPPMKQNRDRDLRGMELEKNGTSCASSQVA